MLLFMCRGFIDSPLWRDQFWLRLYDLTSPILKVSSSFVSALQSVNTTKYEPRDLLSSRITHGLVDTQRDEVCAGVRPYLTLSGFDDYQDWPRLGIDPPKRNAIQEQLRRAGYMFIINVEYKQS